MMTANLFDRFGRWLARKLVKPSSGYYPYTPSDPDSLRAALQPGDVLLVEGSSLLSSGVKYLTQSTWSHAALYVDDALQDGSRDQLIEVIVEAGCIAVPLEKYQTFNTRICRPVGLNADDRKAVVDFMLRRIGTHYDLRNIVDLARYFFPRPPVPLRWRRRMLALGSGVPTRAICSTMIAEAFQSVRYPILPQIVSEEGERPFSGYGYSRKEILHIRHHSLFAPRDFDLSPFFAIVKPTLERGFDYKEYVWNEAKKQLQKPDEESIIKA